MISNQNCAPPSGWRMTCRLSSMSSYSRNFGRYLQPRCSRAEKSSKTILYTCLSTNHVFGVGFGPAKHKNPAIAAPLCFRRVILQPLQIMILHFPHTSSPNSTSHLPLKNTKNVHFFRRSRFRGKIREKPGILDHLITIFHHHNLFRPSCWCRRRNEHELSTAIHPLIFLLCRNAQPTALYGWVHDLLGAILQFGGSGGVNHPA